VEGRLGRIDDFIVTMTLAEATRSFRRDGDSPKSKFAIPCNRIKNFFAFIPIKIFTM
jgi:hypothetical protein